jgi:methylsterol monooxygenase
VAFHYTRAPITQNTSTLVLVGATLALGLIPAVHDAWRTIVETVPEWALVVLVPWVAHQAIFWASSWLALHVDRHDRPKFLAKHRIQSGKPQRPPTARVLRNLAVNQLFWSPLLLWAMWQVLRLRGWAPSPELPGATSLVLEVAGMAVASVVWFYASHRFLHRPWWMKRVHRVHHEFRTSTVMASEYAHWVEFTFGNFMTLAIGILLIAPSLPALYLYALLAIATFLAHHSGYALPWLSWAVHHDWHHYRYNEAFGTLGFIDRMLGTSKELDAMQDGDTR